MIIAPTWRRGLTTPPEIGTQKRELLDVYWGSPYELAWSAVVRSPEIAEALARRGWRLGFMPHPNVQPVLERMDLPAHVEPCRSTGTDVQAIYAQCALLVTDYSSVAFNAAYLDRPVVYYQFDRDEVEAGAHIGRKGYFEYERDGFGPVARTHDEAIAAIVASIEAGAHPTPVYQERIDRTFVDRDGRACERVVAAIEERSRPLSGPRRRPGRRAGEPSPRAGRSGQPRVVGGGALHEAAVALRPRELAVADDDRPAAQHDVGRALHRAALVARVVDVHVVGRGAMIVRRRFGS